jgi:ABC-type uncharacterized transport system fused permease/ATPase subunit
MARFLRESVMRSVMTFLRSDVIRGFFFRDCGSIRWSAWLIVVLVSVPVIAEVSVLSLFTARLEITVRAFQGGTLEQFSEAFWWTVGLTFGLFLIEYARQPANQFFSWYWRETMTCRHMDKLHLTTGAITQVSQRVTEALKSFTQLVLEVYTPILRALVVAMTFLPMLWELSERFTVGRTEGLLVYLVVLYCLAQTTISWLWGRHLVELQAQSQVRESELRSPMEAFENRRTRRAARQTGNILKQHVCGPMRDVYIRIIKGSAHLNGWRSFNLQVFACSLPILMYLAKLGFVANDIATLMKIAAALVTTHGALSIFSELMSKCTELMGSWARLKELEDRVPEVEGVTGLPAFPQAVAAG